MTQTIKPILDSSKGNTGIYIEDGKLYYNGNLLINASESKLLDTIYFKEYPVNIEILCKILKAYGFNDLINSLVIKITSDAKKKLFSIGMGYSLKRSNITHDSESVTFDGVPMTFSNDRIADDSYIIAVNDQLKFLSGNGNRFGELESIFQNKLSELDDIYSRIDTIYNRIDEVQDNTDLPIQVVPKDHISDYVSFENFVVDDGVNSIEDSYTILNFEGIGMLGPKNATYSVSKHLRFVEMIETPKFHRIINEGDILDIVIGYKQLPKRKSKDIFQNLKFNGEPIRFNMYEMTYSNYPLHYLSSTLQVKESTMKLGDKFLIEITKDRLVVYSISPRINEYFIKSCRLIRRAETPEIIT